MFPEDFLHTVPHSPGVYMMLDKKSSVLYVGKAKDLYKRLATYAGSKAAEYNKTKIMLSQVEKVDTIITRTEKEALILEASLIKKHKPKYNIILRDDKNYPLIKVTIQEEWPRVLMTRRRKKDGARYFGPYSSSSAMWATLKLISNLFPLRKCKGAQLRERKRPCLNHQMGKCLAPCTGQADHKLYQHHVNNVLLILEGKNRDLVELLKKDMEEASLQLQFEQAASLRDQIRALEKTLEKQVVASQHKKDQDIIGFSRQGAAVAVSILFIRSGLISGNRSFFFEDPYGDDSAILSQVINQYYDHHRYIPREILLPFDLEAPEVNRERLSELRKDKVLLSVAQRGDRKKLMLMAQANSEQVFSEREKQDRSWRSLAETMSKKLKLNNSPEIVECLDISNFGGKQAVGSLVCFEGGAANKSRYRHYKIRTKDTPDDYAMMREVLRRRFSRGIEENNLPDLFVVDGGKGQLGVALSVAKEFGLEDEMDWLGIAKEKQEEGEKLFKPGRKNPILLPAHNPVLLYIMQIRDESHRYGITFHRKLRNKNTLTSELDRISGIGKERKKTLLKHFGSLKRVKNASFEELKEVNGVGSELAKIIYDALHAE